MTELKVTTVGNSTGIVLSKELLAKLRVQKGDKLFAVETPNGIELTPYNPEFAAQMSAAEDIMHKDRDILKKLAE
jgi:putative addiction module antidote